MTRRRAPASDRAAARTTAREHPRGGNRKIAQLGRAGRPRRSEEGGLQHGQVAEIDEAVAVQILIQIAWSRNTALSDARSRKSDRPVVVEIRVANIAELVAVGIALVRIGDQSAIVDIVIDAVRIASAPAGARAGRRKKPTRRTGRPGRNGPIDVPPSKSCRLLRPLLVLVHAVILAVEDGAAGVPG